MLSVSVLAGSADAATPNSPNQASNWATANDFGGVGLLQTRTARFRDDGELDVGTTILDPYRRYYISFQAMPWLERFQFSLMYNLNLRNSWCIRLA